MRGKFLTENKLKKYVNSSNSALFVCMMFKPVLFFIDSLENSWLKHPVNRSKLRVMISWWLLKQAL